MASKPAKPPTMRDDHTFSLAGALSFTSGFAVPLIAQYWLHTKGGYESVFTAVNNAQSFFALGVHSVAAQSRLDLLLAICASQLVHAAFFAFYISPWRLTLGTGFIGGGFYTTLWTLTGALARRNPKPIGPLDYVGLGVWALGVFFLNFSEFQRKRFKDDPHNKGKPYVGGLFALARHINYFGDTLQWVGIGLVTGSVWGAFAPCLMGFNFVRVLIPQLQLYLHDKYPGYADKVKGIAKFVPFVW